MQTFTSILIVCALLLAVLVWTWKAVINKPSKNYNMVHPTYSYSTTTLFQDLSIWDSNKPYTFQDKLIEIKGRINKINYLQSRYSLEMGEKQTMNSINIQLDERYHQQAHALHLHDSIAVKGIFSGYTKDEELGLGITVQLRHGILTYTP